MNRNHELKKWISDEFPQLTDEEINKSCEDYSELIEWWVSVLLEEALTENTNGTIVEEQAFKRIL